MVLAADYPFLDILGTMLIFFAWVIWFWILIRVLVDVFRRHDEIIRKHVDACGLRSREVPGQKLVRSPQTQGWRPVGAAEGEKLLHIIEVAAIRVHMLEKPVAEYDFTDHLVHVLAVGRDG